MDEILKKLLDNDLLSESTRAELTEQWQTSVETFKQSLREEIEQDVRTEFAGTWVQERKELETKLDDFLNETLVRELTELKGDVERFQEHEVEQAAKIVEMRKTMAMTVAEEMDQLVDNLDLFLEKRLTKELSELREDIEIAREAEFGRQVFESIRNAYETGFVDEKSIQSKLRVTESKLAAANKQIAEISSEKSEIVRESKMQSILGNLTGDRREQMALILKSVPTDKLEENYKRFIGRVLKEGQEQKPLTESATKPTTTVKTGDDAAAIAEATTQATKPAISESLREMQRWAGIIKS